MAVKIAVIERKGGVGKTTIAAHLAAGLALDGEDVLMIDTDSQGDLSRLFDQRPVDNFYRWLVDGANDVVSRIPRTVYDPSGDSENMWDTRLHLLASHSQTWSIPFRTTDPFVMLERISELDERYNTIIIDTAPTYSMLDAMVYLAADYFLIVTECESLSLAGVREGIDSVSRYAKRRRMAGQPGSAVLGIVPNKMRIGTLNHRANIKLLADEFGSLVWNPISQRTKWSEASNFGEMVYRYAPDSVEANEARSLVSRMSEVLNVGA
jgi:chromosome partitioning protein